MATEVSIVLNKWGANLVALTRKKLLAGNKNATGRLNQSIRFDYRYNNGTYELVLRSLPYLINVDKGRRKGARRPPIEPIKQWIKAKHILVGGRASKSLVPRGKKTPTDQQLTSYAYAIATNISKKGIKPFPIFDTIRKVNQDQRFKRELAQAIAKDITKQLKFKL